MSILSFSFFITVATALSIYWMMPTEDRWAVLLLYSTLFILLGTGFTIRQYLIFAAMSLTAWGGVYAANKATREKTKNVITGAVIAGLAATLIMFKELSFFFNNANRLGDLLGFDFGFVLPDWIAPFGISYFTLILIGYILDCRMGRIKTPQSNPFKFLLFSGYFPHMTSGPFTRYNDISDKLLSGSKFDYDNFCFGLQRFIWGLFKKLVVADRIAFFTAQCYDAQASIIVVAVGILCYLLQVYLDFSGCMDIVIGISQCFGIPLAENFNTPFYSTSLSEFWRRWHMTLGFWLKDYVLYAVLKSRWMAKIRGIIKRRFGKKASKSIPTYIGMFIVWFCVGFWHGGSWKYIFSSGIYFFILILLGLLLEPLTAKAIEFLKIKTDRFLWIMLQRVRTMLLFGLGISFGRAGSLSQGINRLLTAFTDINTGLLMEHLNMMKGWLLGDKVIMLDILIIAAGLIAVFFVGLIQNHYGSVREYLAKQNLVLRWSLFIALLFFVIIFGKYGPGYDASAFIYGGF